MIMIIIKIILITFMQTTESTCEDTGKKEKNTRKEVLSFTAVESRCSFLPLRE